MFCFQEERDRYIGHVFGLMALVRANTTVKGSDLIVEVRKIYVKAKDKT